MDDTAAQLTGTWEMTRAEFGGEIARELVDLGVELELTAETYVVRFAGQIADRGSYVLNTITPAAGSSTKSHGLLTLTGTEGANQSRTIPSIFQLAGHRLRICYGLDGKIPAGFTTQPGIENYLASYRRMPPPPALADSVHAIPGRHCVHSFFRRFWPIRSWPAIFPLIGLI